MVPDPGGYATEWRARNRAHHERRFQKLTLGQVIKLTNGEDYRITNLKPLRGMRADLQYGPIYRIPRRMLTVKEVSNA